MNNRQVAKSLIVKSAATAIAAIFLAGHYYTSSENNKITFTPKSNDLNYSTNQYNGPSVQKAVYRERIKSLLSFYKNREPIYFVSTKENSLDGAVAPANSNIPENQNISDPSGQTNFGNNPFEIKPVIIPEEEELLVNAKLNYNNLSEYYSVIKKSEKEILVPREFFKDQFVKESYLNAASQKIGEIEYIDLSKLDSADVNFDYQNLFIEVKTPPDSMEPQFIDARQNNPVELSPVSNGAYMNYNAFLNNSKNRTAFSMTSELNGFNERGNLNSTFITKFGEYPRPRVEGFKKVMRLETNWIERNHKDMTQLKIGDTFTRAPDWAGGTRFAGIQFATDFSTRPNIITYPLPEFSGRSDLPSSIEVFADTYRLFNTNLRPGDFDLTNLPIPNGSGDIIVKRTDLNGQEETFVIPFYSSQELLKPELSRYSFGAGAQRRFLGSRHDRYYGPVLNADYSYGVNDYFTTSGHFTSIDNDSNLGITETFKLWKIGVLSGSIGTNTHKPKKAQKGRISYDYSNSLIGLGTSIAAQGKNFIDVNQRPSLDRSSKPQTQSFFSISGGDYGSISLSYSTLTTLDKLKNKIGTFSYNKTLAEKISFQLSASRFKLQGQKPSTTVLASFNFILGSRENMRFDLMQQTKQTTLKQFEYNSLPVKVGQYGFRAKASEQTRGNYEFEGKSKHQYGESSIRTSKTGQQESHQISSNGSLVFIDNSLFASEQIFSSLALIKSGGIKNTGVFRNNTYIGKTDEDGSKLVPNLPPYQLSEISLDEQDVPLSANFSSLSQKIVPRTQSGAVVSFDAKEAISVEMDMKEENGTPIPVGYQFNLDGINQATMVGYEGKVFINDLPSDIATLKGTVCRKENKDCCSFETPLKDIDQDRDSYYIIGKVKCTPIPKQ